MKFETKQHHVRTNVKKLVLSVVFVFAGIILYIVQLTPNPLPPTIRSQVNFKVIVPVSSLIKIDSSSYNYDSDNRLLSFDAIYQGNTISFNEQIAPESIGTDAQPYYSALGIHPYAQFKVSLGTVALTKFWQAGTLIPNGQSGLLLAKGTLLTVHSKNSLSNQQWKAIFNTTKIVQ